MKGKTMKKSDFKKKIKHYAPEIFVGASIVAGAAALVYIAKDINDHPDGDKDGVVIPYTALNRISSGKESLAFELDGESFLIKHLK